MATSLQQQLAAIASNSTHQLDLKAQKSRHSKSLLFEPRDAAAQSFDTIFQICYEGFEELCMVDARFSPFARNLFSEQSKNEDRTQMTAKENTELDKVVESFLGLATGRLLLKPAMKAVEWLVRRFRVEEYNTEAILLTFLPYHTSHIFPTLMSILPEQLPSSFRFLHPYVASLQCPPRHAVLSAAINNPGFFSALSQYVLRVATARHHSAVLVGFWASITAQAVNGMIDSTRSGRESIRKQREEDVLLRVLPILQSALSIRGVPELYLGACMIMTILATKASLEDQTLGAMMQAVAGAWTQETLDDGLTCLAVIAEEKQHATQPQSVTRAILRIESPETRIKLLSQRLRVDKLVLSTCLGAVESSKVDKQQVVTFTTSILGQGALSTPHVEYLLNAVVGLSQPSSDAEADAPSRSTAISLLENIVEHQSILEVLSRVAGRAKVDLSQISPQLRLQAVQSDTEMNLGDSPEPMEIDLPDSKASEEATSLMAGLRELTQRAASCLDPAIDSQIENKPTVSGALALLSMTADQQLSSADAHEPTFLTFLANYWVRESAPVVQTKAIESAFAHIKTISQGSGSDMQGLLPYALAALANPSQRVRRAAASLCLTFKDSFGKNPKDARVWATDSLYGTSSGKLHRLPPQDSYKFLTSVLLPSLEDCVLDDGHIARVIVDALQGAPNTATRPSNSEQKQMKSLLRAEICVYLASHAAVTPLVSVKLQLLEMLNKVGKVCSDARKTVLLPLVKEWCATQSQHIERCTAQGMSPHELNKAVVGSLSHRSAEELQLLKAIAAGEGEYEEELSALASQHLRKLWTAMKIPSQVALVDFFLDLAVESADHNTPETIQSDALDSLRGLSMPTEVLVHLVSSLPTASDLQDQPSSAKKQRTNKADAARPRKPDQTKIKSAIRRITVVLELLEGSKPERHPQLSKGLFHLLGELHHYKTLLGSQLVYIQGLLMSCLLAVVDGLKDSSSADIDRSVIRADLIVECVRTTSSTQVHNTALLLMSSLAGWAPELVLHSVMPLFTFMSTTLLRQSDDFSAHVTDQTVARIVPPLAASLKKKGRDLVSGAAELLLSFTAAFEHIPLHRRAALFQHLVQTLGPDDSLFAVIAMLVERYPTDSRVVPFVSDLANNFPVSTQMQAFKKYLNLIFDALKPKRGLSDVILSLGEKDTTQIELSIESLLQGLSQLLTSSVLRKRLGKEFAKDATAAEALQTTYSELLDQTMLLNRELESNAALQDSAEALLTALLGLTPTKDFIESSAKLMQTGSDETRQQVFHSLEARVSQAKRGDAILQQTFIEVLPNCCIFLDTHQPIGTRHAAITCIDQIVEKYGKKDRTAVLDAAEHIAGDAALGSDTASLRTISMLCLASMVEVLQDDFIGVLPQVFERILNYLEHELTSNKAPDSQLHSAAFGFASAVLDHLPWMFSAQYLDRAIKLAARSVGRENASSTISATANDFCTLAAKNVNASELFSSLQRTWTDIDAVAMARSESAYQPLKLLHQAIQYHTKATITRDAPTLFVILFEAFDLRRQLPADEQRAEVFALVDQIALDMTLKLNDATFRPFFIRLVDWTTSTLPKRDSQGRTQRAISLYSFTHVMFEQLKSIVTSYASYILDSASNLLGTVTPSTEAGRLLLEMVLQTLASSFRHDQDDFWQAPAHFDAVAAPLLHQLEKAKAVNVSDHIIPTITEFAAAASSPDHLKAINTTIMSYMRHQDAMVRLAAVKSERAITDKLNFDWLALLPEMLPFISELQEDDDEDVERETLRWVKQIEDVTGESLEGMLQ